MLAFPPNSCLQHWSSSTFMIISEGKLVEVYVFFALHPCTPILWPGTGRGPWLILRKSLAGQGWPHIWQGELPARALLETSLELLLIHPDVKMSRSQARSPQWWGVSSIPFQGKYQAPLMRKKKKKGFFALYLQTPPQNNMGERRIANIQWGILSSFFSSWRKKFPTQIKTRWSPGAPPADLREQREGRCLVVCQAFSTGLVALWCGTWSSRGLEPALQMQQELSWKRAS